MGDEQEGRTRHRRRRRGGVSDGAAPADGAVTAAAADGQTPSAGSPGGTAGARRAVDRGADGAAPAEPRRARRARAGGRDSLERGLRDLVGAGRSQLGVSGALRGRDVNRPTEADIAEAERELVIVRRNWQPPAR